MFHEPACQENDQLFGGVWHLPVLFQVTCALLLLLIICIHIHTYIVIKIMNPQSLKTTEVDALSNMIMSHINHHNYVTRHSALISTDGSWVTPAADAPMYMAWQTKIARFCGSSSPQTWC